MAEFLRCVAPGLLPAGASFQVVEFGNKQQLLRKLPERLAGYRHWVTPGHVLVVVVDRDEDDCHALKARLEEIAAQAQLSTRSFPKDGQFTVLTRLAIEELEAWYFGDWEAVRAAWPRVPADIPQKAGYRDSDSISGGTWEAFERVLQRAGYFRSGLRKVEAAQAIAPHIDPARSRSRSFQVFRDAILEL